MCWAFARLHGFIRWIGIQNVKRKMATAQFTGIDTVTTYKDIAADDGKVLETTIAPGKSKIVEVKVAGG